MTKTAIQFFLVILLGSIISAVIGGLFASVVGWIAPDFVNDLFASYKGELKNPIRYAMSVGMIWGAL